ncbi:prolipoprotein diacylglyceryl transferase [Christensenellaceae bacterium OttesenSCG-928-M15]|nr:prolipoprotein diacylglyceryl transferase [Christensenellaceae bacterium OttesenSCG-928-M15]
MHSELFSIGSFTIHSYGLMIALGFLAAILVGTSRIKGKGYGKDTMLDVALIAIVCGIVGAKLLYYITEIGSIIENPRLLLEIGNGFVVYGGIIAGVLGAYVYCRKKKYEFLPLFDLLIPCVPLAQGFGRIGCFLAGCCYGRPTDAWYGLIFPTAPEIYQGVPLIPTQLFSAIGDFAIFAALLLIARKQKFGGQIASAYLLLYGVGRFIIEFFRDDPRGAVGGLSTSQFISIFIVAAGIVGMVLGYRAHRNKTRMGEQ